ncbi:BTAD domain-containing putative transcriptional regulator [Pseudoroseomonas globiformis]|uniref:BTAD domain-containing putative transcriptional regulator n=1 Tax=Teichococcus globiformis TaxID=2307229 RepID=A0ABV7G9Z8_9PROT
MVPSATAARLTLFGGVRLETASGAAVSFPTRRAQRLLAMLVLAPPQGLARDSLAEALWPEAAPCDSRHALATELWRLRRVLHHAGAADWVQECGGRLLVNQAARDGADVHAFESALLHLRSSASPAARRAAVAEVERLHAGDFMAGDSDEWSLSRRAFFTAQRIDALVVGLELARDAGDGPEVIRLGHVLMLSDPLLEIVSQEMMRAYLLTGNSAAALAVFHRLERVLQAELSVCPAAETRALRDLALAARQWPAALAPASRSAASTARPLPERLHRLAEELHALAGQLR